MIIRPRYNNRSVLLCIAFVAVLGLASCATEAALDTDLERSAETNRPNIILVMTDDQGYGDLGINDNPIIQTPVIDQFASESVSFTNFHVDPTCSPTRSALMSGKYSMRAGVWHTVMGRHMLSDNHYTLPEILKDAGYDTAMMGKWHLGDNYPFRPQDQGFDHVVIHGGGGVGQTPDYWGNTQFDDTFYVNGEEKGYSGFATDVWFDEAIDYVRLKAEEQQPFFLYVSTNAPHTPYRAPEAYAQPYRDLGLPENMAHFYGMITNIDDNMDRLLKAVSAEEIEDNTIIIFMTDNGSSYAAKKKGEPLDILPDAVKAQFGEALTTLNAGMRAGKASTYDGGHRVPFYIKWPGGKFKSPAQVNDLSAHIDILPTLLDLAGLDADGLDTDGISLTPAIQDGQVLPDRTLVVTNQRVLNPDPQRPYAVMQGDWRYVHAAETGGTELFDVSIDPGQTNDISADHPARVAAMSDAYDAWWQHVTAAGTPTTRIVIGSDRENPSRLTAMDVLAPNTGQVPWWPGFAFESNDEWTKGWVGNEDKFQVSPWALKVEEAGTYKLSLYVHDKPAGKVVPNTYAHLKLGDQTLTSNVQSGSISADFVTDLDAGNVDVEAWFDDQADGSATGGRLPAFFMYAERLED
ncbi:MAG: arylsulfatase [Litorimonas sp.]